MRNDVQSVSLFRRRNRLKRLAMDGQTMDAFGNASIYVTHPSLKFSPSMRLDVFSLEGSVF